MTQSNTPAGWYDDGHGSERFWDGNAWTEQTRPLGGGSTPEAPAAPEAPATPDSAATMFAPGGGAPSTPSTPSNPATPTPQAAPTPEPEAPSSNADVTRVAPSGGFGAQAPATPGWQQPQQQQPQPGAPAQPAAPAWQQPGQPGQPAAPAWQQPGQAGQPGQFGQQGAPAWQQQPFAGPGAGGGGSNTKLIIALAGGGGALLLLIVVLVLVLGGGGDPKSVAEDYLQASAKGDVKKVCELSTKKEQEDAFEEYDVDSCGDYVDELKDDSDNNFSDYSDYADDLDVDIKVEDADEKEKSAEVDYTQKVKYTGNDDELAERFGGECYEVKGTVELKKEDGDWKVSDDNTDYDSYKTC